MFNLSLILRIVPIILAFVAGVFLTTKCTADKRGEQTEQVVTQVKTDTITHVVYVPRNVQKTIYVAKPTVRVVYRDQVIPAFQADSTPTLTLRRYQDTVVVAKNLKVSYDAEVTGLLNHIALTYQDTRKDSVITKVVTTEITEKTVKHPIGVYVGLTGQLDGSKFGPSLSVVNSRFSVNASYNLVRNNFTQGLAPVQLSLGFKLGK